MHPLPILALLLFCFAAAAGEHMNREEQPDQMGLTIVGDACFPAHEGTRAVPVRNGNLEARQEKQPDAWPLYGGAVHVVDATDAPEGKAYVQAPDGAKASIVSPDFALADGQPYLLSLWARTTCPVRAVLGADTPARFLKWIYLSLPSTEGKWKRVGLYFRPPFDAKSGNVTFRIESEDARPAFALDDLQVRTATEAEFAQAYKGWRATKPEHEAAARPGDGKHLALSIEKLQGRGIPGKPFLIWAIGSSYTNMLGNGQTLIQAIRERFPAAPPIAYRKHCGSAVPFEFVRGWARQFVVSEQPDLVLIYTLGDAAGLETMLDDLRRRTTADIVVPSLHLRRNDKNDETSIESAYWKQIREVCMRFDVEFIENRREGAAFLTRHGLSIEDVTRDNVHQNDLGALIINENIARHFAACKESSYDPAAREQTVPARDAAGARDWKDLGGGRLAASAQGAALELKFNGIRADLLGVRVPGGGALKVFVDGKPAAECPVFFTTYMEPGEKNKRPEKGLTGDQSPHAVKLGPVEKLVPQTWVFKMLDDEGNYELAGSVAGPDGKGHVEKPFAGASGQISLEPELWRRPKHKDGYNVKAGDTWTFEVYRAVAERVDFKAPADKEEFFSIPLVQNLPCGEHTVRVEAESGAQVVVSGFRVYTPPLK